MTEGRGVAVCPDIAGPLERLQAGAVFVGLLFDDREQRAAALETALAAAAADAPRIIWVGNPLRAPLTLERFLIQIVGPEVDLRVDRGPEELAAIVAKPVGSESRLLIVVQQPETIDAATRDRLAAMAPYLQDRPVRTQFLFAGPAAFAVPAIAPPDLTAFAPALPPISAGFGRTSAPARRVVVTVLLLVLTLAVGLWFSFAPASQVDPPPAPPIAEASPAPEPPRPAPELPDETAMLRREFEAFLAGRADSLPPLSGKEKDALFLEFLDHRKSE